MTGDIMKQIRDIIKRKKNALQLIIDLLRKVYFR